MSCYHPMIGIPTGEVTEKGKRKLEIVSAKSIDYDPRRKECRNLVVIPCGKCIGCRLDYSRQWADRMMLELESNNGKGLFVTLTYDNEHAHWTQFDENDNPMYATVDKRDCQLFMKSLRGREKFAGIGIRFYLSSEYGPKTLRPHVHCILFGIDRSDLGDCLDYGKNELGQKYYESKLLEDCWKNGRVLCSDVSYRTCAYVARYVTKKLIKDDAYARRNVEKEFSLMSRNPGIGAKYLEKHPECLDLVNIPIKGEDKKVSIPSYFLRKLELTDKKKFDKLCRQRKKLAVNTSLLKLKKTDLSCIEYLEKGEMLKIESLKKLKDAKV